MQAEGGPGLGLMKYAAWQYFVVTGIATIGPIDLLCYNRHGARFLAGAMTTAGRDRIAGAMRLCPALLNSSDDVAALADWASSAW